MAEPDDEEGPLIAAIRERRTLEEIKAIVEADPSLLQRRWDLEGILLNHLVLPLHLAIVERLPADIVHYLLKKWPESVREWTIYSSLGRYSLPVHLACEQCKHDDDMSTVLLLLKAWPKSIRERNKDGNLPVHMTENLELIKLLVKRWRHSVRVPGIGRDLLLHNAIRNDFPLPMIKFLVKQYPESIRARNEEGGTPLHCMNCELSTDKIDYLLKKGGEEDLLLVPNDKGYLPLHCFLEESTPYICKATLKHLIDRSPQSVRVKSNDGYLPFHVAMKQEFTEFVVESLIDEWPEAINETTNDGYLPLHVAAEAGEIENIDYLLKQNPDAVKVQSTKGLLPVHLLLQYEPMYRCDVEENKWILDKARDLVDLYPASAHVATNDGLLPLHVALRTGYGCCRSEADDDGQEEDVEAEFIRYLVDLAPVSVHVASKEILFPFDYAIRSFYVSFQTVRFLGEKWPDVALARHVDSEGRTALYVAASQEAPRPDIVRFVAELEPQNHETKARDGSLPLHAAVSRFPARNNLLYDSNAHEFPNRDEFLQSLQDSMEIVGYLADQRPQSLVEGDNLGNIPLHSALARDLASIDVVKQLVRLRPDSTGIANRNGSLPLHIALTNCRPEVPTDPDSNDSEYKPRPTPALDIVKFLVEQRPPSVRAKDSKGNIPLVVAASSDADLNVLFYLLKQWPEACGGGGSSCDVAVAGPTPTSRPRKRVKTSNGDGP